MLLYFYVRVGIRYMTNGLKVGISSFLIKCFLQHHFMFINHLLSNRFITYQ